MRRGFPPPRRWFSERRYGLRRMSEAEARQAWSQFQRANPFVAFAQAMGRDPSEELPGLVELASHVFGWSRKSPAEVAVYEREVSARLDRYMSDIGLERRASFEVAAKREEQSVEDFLRGAAQARDVLLKHHTERPTEEEAWFVEETALGPSLRKALLAATTDATDPDPTATSTATEATATEKEPFLQGLLRRATKDVATVRLSRASFALLASDLEYPAAAKTTNVWSLIDVLLNRPSFSFDAVVEDAGALCVYERDSGTFYSCLDMNKDPDLLRDAQTRGLPSALRRRNLVFPLPKDLADPAATLRGFLLADATFAFKNDNSTTETWTFARQTDHRPDARWIHDWRIVDVDNLVAQNDWRRLSTVLSGFGESEEKKKKNTTTTATTTTSTT